MSTSKVLIVGAGPTGLVMALSLARLGIPVRIIDKNKGPGTASRAMVVHARTLEYYQQLGFADEVVGSGIRVERLAFHRTPAETITFNFGELGKVLSPFPFILSYPQDEHETLLVQKLAEAGVSVEWQTEMKSLKNEESSVKVEIADSNGTIETHSYEYVCGCDGAHSDVRHALALQFPGAPYEQLFFVADVKAHSDVEEVIEPFLSENSFVLWFPLRRSGMKRIIGIVPREIAAKTEITFEDVRPYAEKTTGRKIESLNWFSIYRTHHRVAKNFRVGRCFVAGDAAHIHSPAGGQGMNTGIGDAINLSWKMAAVLKKQANPNLLDSYDIERSAFARRLVATTDRAFRGIVDPGRTGRMVRTAIIPKFAALLTRVVFIRRLMFRIVSQIQVTYANGPFNFGQVGRIRSGDRLPWIASGKSDNFEPLTSLNWQIHIYGVGEANFRKIAARRGIPLIEFTWSNEARRAGFIKNAYYVIRPDGHIAAASETQTDLRPLDRLIDSLALTFQ